MVDFNKYIQASLPEQMEMLIEAMKNKHEQLKPENFLFASWNDRILMIVDSVEKEQKRIDSGYYNTAPLIEQIAFFMRQLEKQIKAETRMKIETVEFHLKWLNENIEGVELLLNKVDKTLPNVGNLENVNALLDKLRFLLKEVTKKYAELNSLKE